MKILLVDCRKDRGQMLAQVFAESNRRVITHSEHVNGVGGSVLDIWNCNARKACEDHLDAEGPDLVMLHVGRDQRRWRNCLEDIYQDDFVVCFTGGNIEEVKVDCAANPKHCYYPGVFATEYPTDSDCRHSSEVNAILHFIDGVEEYVKKVKDSPVDAKETLQKAKETLQQFNSGLETVLNELTEELWKLLQGRELPTKEELDDLAKKRNAKFRLLTEPGKQLAESRQ